MVVEACLENKEGWPDPGVEMSLETVQADFGNRQNSRDAGRLFSIERSKANTVHPDVNGRVTFRCGATSHLAASLLQDWSSQGTAFMLLIVLEVNLRVFLF